MEYIKNANAWFVGKIKDNPEVAATTIYVLVLAFLIALIA